MHRVIPERADRFMFDVGTTQADILQCFVTHAGQHLALTAQFIPATQPVQQIGDPLK